MKAKPTLLTHLLDINFPLMLAPMYMVSSEKMSIEAINAGIAACMPAQNWQSIEAMRVGIQNIKKSTTKGGLGINLWAHKSNENLAEQIAVCTSENIDFIYSSLGSPAQILKAFENSKTKVFCKVLNISQALKAEKLGADALIISNKNVLEYKQIVNIPIIVSGEINSGKAINKSIHKDQTAGCVIGSLFIAAAESAASLRYKNACISYTAKNVVLTEKEMPFPISVLNTPYIRRQGKNKTFLNKLFYKIAFINNYLKQKQFKRTLKKIEKAAKDETHQKLWLASKSIHQVQKISTTTNIINSLIATYEHIEKQKTIMARSISREI